MLTLCISTLAISLPTSLPHACTCYLTQWAVPEQLQPCVWGVWWAVCWWVHWWHGEITMEIFHCGNQLLRTDLRVFC